MIASATANDGEAVAQQRRQRVVNAVSGTSQTNGTTEQVLSTVHSDLVVPNTDGVIAFITLRPPVVSVCHSVFRARTENQFRSAVKTIQSMTVGDIQQVLNRTEMIPLGDVLFQERTDTVFGDGSTLETVNTKWEADPAKVREAAVFSQPSAPDEASRKAQSLVIAGKLNDGTVPAAVLATVPVATAVNMPTTCPAFTILLPEVPVETVCLTVYRTNNDSAFNNAVNAVQSLPPGSSIQNNIIVRNNLTLIDSPQFEANTINVVGNSMNAMLAKWRALPGSGGLPILIAAVLRKDATADDEKGIHDQAASIRTNIGGTQIPVNMVRVDPSLIFPTNCRGFVIILATGQ
jgi:hypothetical protein